MASNALTFDGSTQYGKISNFAAIDAMTDGTITMETWVKVYSSPASYMRLLSMGVSGAGADTVGIEIPDATTEGSTNFHYDYATTSADGFTPTGAWTYGNWVHIALICSNGAKSKILWNGIESSYSLQQTPVGTVTVLDANVFVIGDISSLDGVRFKGEIGGFVRVWNIAREITDVRANYRKWLRGDRETGLIINLNLQEGSGTTLTNDASVGNDMILTGNPSWVPGYDNLTWKRYDLPGNQIRSLQTGNGVSVSDSLS